MLRDDFGKHPRHSRRRFISGAGLMVGSLTLAACAGASAGPTPVTGAPAASPVATGQSAPSRAASPVSRPAKYGGAFRTGIGSTDPPHLDVHQTSALALHAVGPGMAYSQLLWYKNGPSVSMPNFEVEGDLAESWTQPDETTYLFKLRPGVKWQNVAPVNGREVVADDVAYSFQRQIAEKVNASTLEGIAKIEAPDRSTVRIQLDKPNVDFLWSLASVLCKVIPKETVDLRGDLKEGPVIGSGPWIFDTWEKGQSVSLKRNPDFYRKDRPYLDTYTWLRISDAQTMLNGFRSQNMDAIQSGFTKTDVDALKRQSPELVVRTGAGASRFEVMLKSDRPPFNDKRMREAFSKAINRQEIIDAVLGGVASINSGLTVASDAQALPAAEVKQILNYDPEAAQRLMREAGVDRVDVQMEVPDFIAGLVVQAGELMQAQLAKVNINLKLNVLQGTAWIAQVRVGGQYHTSLGLQSGLAPTNTELVSRHYSKGSLFTHGAADPDLDAMIERQATMAKDPAGRAKLLQDIQRRFLSDYGYVPLFTQDALYVAWPYVKDWNINQATNNPSGDSLHIWLDK